MGLAGKAAIVTGAGSRGTGYGLGKATAIRLARDGANILLVDKDGDVVEDTRRLIQSAGGTAQVIVADVASSADWTRIADACRSAFGRLDILVNNVGIVSKAGLLAETEESWDRVLAVNLKSVFLGARAVVPAMIEGGGGRIVNLASTGALRMNKVPTHSYVASKAAVIQLTRSIAVEFAGQGIRCNCIVPGGMDTPMVHEAFRAQGLDAATIAAVMRQRDAQSPTGKMGEPWDIAGAVAFLVSDDAKFVNGAMLVVDGGMTQQVYQPPAM